MRLLIDAQTLQRPDRPDLPWQSCLKRLLPALIEAAPSQGMTPHLLLNAAWPKTLPPLYRRFADLYRDGQIHGFHGITEEQRPSPACLSLEAFALVGLGSDLVLFPGGPDETETERWLRRLLPEGIPLHDLYASKYQDKFIFINPINYFNPSDTRASEPSAPLTTSRPYLLCIGPPEEVDHCPLTDLITAFARLTAPQRLEWDLVLAGSFTPAQTQKLQGFAQDQGVPAAVLRFCSDLDPEGGTQLIAQAGLLVDLNKGSILGTNPLDAMAAGTPVLAPGTALNRWILGGSEGLFEPADPDGLLAALRRFLSAPEALQALIRAQTEEGRCVDWPKTATHLLRHMAAEQGLTGRKPPQPAPTWDAEQARLDALEAQTIIALQENSPNDSPQTTLEHISRALTRTRADIENALRGPAFPIAQNPQSWRIEGPFDTSYSLASVNRETARALTRAGWPVALFSAEGPGPYAPNEAYLEAHPDLGPLRAAAEKITDLQAFVTSRNMYPPRCDDMRGPLNLLHGYAWEETGFPAAYLRDINTHLQGLLVTTPHVKRVLINAGITVPITVVGNGVDHIEGAPAPLPHPLPEAQFRILHVSWCLPRKGPDVLLEAFAQAFSGDSRAAEEVSLVIKTAENPHHNLKADIAALQKAHPVLPPIVLETTDFSAAQMRSLFKAADLLVAPSRAEGFCLPIAEAVLGGTPVLTTGWSGQMVFAGNPMVQLIDYDFEMATSHLDTSDSVWATPRATDLARLMRAARVNRPTPQEVQAGAAAIRKIHTWDNVAEKSIAAVEKLAQHRASLPPRLGWVSTFNTRCGIATYSDHLLRALPDQAVVLANHSTDLQAPDPKNVLRCWQEGKDDTLLDLRAAIAALDLETIVIQFNYGFYNFAALGRLILWLKSEGRQVVLMMHGTDDRPHGPENRLLGLRAELALCDRLLVHSVHDLNRLKALGLVDNAALFPHGVPEVHPLAAKRDTPGARQSFVLGTYGFLLPHKGYPELIETLALLRAEGRDVRLRMVNAAYPAQVSVDLAEGLRQRIAALDLSAHVDLCTDFLEDAESVQRLSEADLLVFPYRITSESASGALRQAIAVSRPIAVTPLPIFDDVGGLVMRLPGLSAPDMASGLGQMIDDLRHGGATGTAAQNLQQANQWRRAAGYGPLAARLWRMLCALHADQAG